MKWIVNPVEFLSDTVVLKKKLANLFEREEELTPRRIKVSINKRFQVWIWLRNTYLEYPDYFAHNETLAGDTHHKCTALAKNHSYVMMIPWDVFETFLKDHSWSFVEWKMTFIYNAIPGLAEIHSFDAVKEFLLENFIHMKFNKGQEYLWEGEVSDKFYIIRSGTCNLFKTI